MGSIAVEQGTPEWHDLRLTNIGSSEAAVLVAPDEAKFGRSLFQLHHEKSGTLPPVDLSENERVVLGSCLEAGVAEAIQQLYNVKLRKVRRYITHPTVTGMAASLDYEQLTEDAGWVPAEIKLVDRSVFRAEWQEDDDLGLVPPAHYLIQVQHQLACVNKPYGFIYPLVGGNELKHGKIPRHDKLIAVIETSVRAFWDRIKNREEPPVDYTADREAMQRVFLSYNPGEADLSTDLELAALVEEYRAADIAEKEATKVKDRVKAQLFDRLKDFEAVRAPGARITCKLVEAKPARMVEYKAQPARREMRVYLSKSPSDSK